MYSLVIHTIDKEEILQDGSKQIAVSFSIMEGEKELKSARLGFPYDMKSDEIKKELMKYKDTFLAELQARAEQDQVDAQEDTANATIDELKDITL